MSKGNNKLKMKKITLVTKSECSHPYDITGMHSARICMDLTNPVQAYLNNETFNLGSSKLFRGVSTKEMVELNLETL